MGQLHNSHWRWHWCYHSSLYCSSFKTFSAEAASQLAASSRQPPSENSTPVCFQGVASSFKHTKSACSMNGFVVIKWSLIVNWLLKKSENIGKKRFSLLCSIVFCSYRLRQEQSVKYGNSSYRCQKCLSCETFSCSDDTRLIKNIGKSITNTFWKSIGIGISNIFSA